MRDANPATHRRGENSSVDNIWPATIAGDQRPLRVFHAAQSCQGCILRAQLACRALLDSPETRRRRESFRRLDRARMLLASRTLVDSPETHRRGGNRSVDNV